MSNQQDQTTPLFGLLEPAEGISEGTLSQINELLIKAHRLEDIIMGWMDREKDQTLWFGKGDSDCPETLGQPAIFVGFYQEHEEVAVAQCTTNALIKVHGKKLSLDGAKVRFTEHGLKDLNNWRKKRNAQLQVKEDALICSYEIKKEAAIALLVAYFASRWIVEVWSSYLDDMLICDLIDGEDGQEKLYEQYKKTISMDLAICEKDHGQGMRGVSHESFSFMV